MKSENESPVFQPEVHPSLWTDWRWQIAHRFTGLQDLKALMGEEFIRSSDFEACLERFRWTAPPFWAQKVIARGADSPLWKQTIPSAAELEEHPQLEEDPLGEDADSPLPGLVHRYPDRVLFLLTNRCAVYCRHCNRRRRTRNAERDASTAQIGRWLGYVSDHPEIREVILSGGDPLLWSDFRLNRLLKSLREIPTLEIIRISTRIPVVLPVRITNNLCRLLSRYHPLFVNIHVNHAEEISPEMMEACRRLCNHGIPLGSQTVLLKGINDDGDVLHDLFRNLLKLRIKPYALYHCDPVAGAAHFRTSIAAGRALMEEVIRRSSGLAVPHYIADAPGGAGKVPLASDYVVQTMEGRTRLRTPWGREIDYP